jgi:unsaturated chondroitin disaccharide hydrolase
LPAPDAHASVVIPTPVMKLLRFLRPVFLAFAASGAAALNAAEVPLRDIIRDDLDFAAKQYSRMLEQMNGKTGFPRTVDKGEFKTVKANDWTSGFFAGSLWYLHDATGDAKWRDAAVKYTEALEAMKNNKGTHDLGFVLYCSYGNALRVTHDSKYRDVLLTGAESLSTRFSPIVGCIKSWDGRKQWDFPVIIDNMMNLELLTWAAEAGNVPKLRDISIAHADTTMKNHYRPDYSSYHVVDYDHTTGAVRSRVTHQGYANESAWSRGQSWGFYGYTMMYRQTKKPEYLAQAQKIAAFLMNHPRMPADKVPYWDFDDPAIPHTERDASAAAIMASALLELRGYVDAPTAKSYTDFAYAQLRSLSSPAYRARLGENGCFLLMHSTGHKPGKSEIDVPLNYADYYFLEALLRAKAGLK